MILISNMAQRHHVIEADITVSELNECLDLMETGEEVNLIDAINKAHPGKATLKLIDYTYDNLMELIYDNATNRYIKRGKIEPKNGDA